jgi:hypothetical protein
VKNTLNPTVLEPSPPGFQISTDPDTSERCIRARSAFEVGDVIATFAAREIHASPDRLTVQVDEATHIELDPTWLRFLEHACEPNVALDVSSGRVVAVRAIAPGEVLAYFYPSTEWEMAAPFLCRCGSSQCLGHIAGASQLPLTALVGRRLAPHIARRLGLEVRNEQRVEASAERSA